MLKCKKKYIFFITNNTTLFRRMYYHLVVYVCACCERGVWGWWWWFVSVVDSQTFYARRRRRFTRRLGRLLKVVIVTDFLILRRGFTHLREILEMLLLPRFLDLRCTHLRLAIFCINILLLHKSLYIKIGWFFRNFWWCLVTFQYTCFDIFHK